MNDLTNAVAASASTMAEHKAAIREFILGHVMTRVIHSREWNVPFAHVGFLDVFRLDQGMLVLTALLLIFLFGVLYRKKQTPPRGLTNLLESVILFIRDKVSIAFLGEKDGRLMAPLFCSFFFFIAAINLLGLIPCFVAATGNVNVTGGLAAVTLAFMILGGIMKKGPIGFVKMLLPSGVPWYAGIILAPIELVSMFTKAFALTIRLFANMLAGHITIFCVVSVGVLFGLGALPIVLVGIGIFFFEIFVCIFQAYIFTLLSAVFIGQIYHGEH